MAEEAVSRHLFGMLGRGGRELGVASQARESTCSTDGVDLAQQGHLKPPERGHRLPFSHHCRPGTGERREGDENAERKDQ